MADVEEAKKSVASGAGLLRKTTTTQEFGICSSLDLCALELPFTGILATALHSLCFAKAEQHGYIVHQGPTRKLRGDGEVKKGGAAEAVDIEGFEMTEDGPGWPFFGLEGKREELSSALKGMAAYANVMSRPHTTGHLPHLGILGLATSTLAAVLSIYFPDDQHERMHAITIMSGKVDDLVLLAVLCAANRHLCVYPLCRDTYLTQPEPFISDEEVEPLYPNKTCNRVFRIGNIVRKVFDLVEEPYFSPNVEFSNRYGGLEAQQYSVTKDNRIIILEYPFIEGECEPNDIRQFLPICEMLDRMHTDKVVHGDVRIENMIFTTDIQKSYLIDFDMAKKEGERYPGVFNGSLAERHTGAKKGRQMLTSHDRHSLKYTVKKLYDYELKLKILKKPQSLVQALKSVLAS